MVYVCENSDYGELSAARLVVSVPDISARAAGYGIPGITVDGQDVVAVYEAVSEAVARARRGEGPSLVETKTYRFRDHAFGLPERAYRDQAEVDEWRKRDPLELFRARLLADGVLDDAAAKALEDAVSAEIEAAIEFCRVQPLSERGRRVRPRLHEPDPGRNRPGTTCAARQPGRPGQPVPAR